MQIIVANGLGLLAVALFVLSYQLRARRGIILLNAASRILYVAQYLVLGAFEGAALDAAAFAISLLCSKRDRGFVKAHLPLVILCSNALILAVGVLTWRSIFSLLAIAGVLLETLALWFSRERIIRIVSLFAAPCWLAYNLVNVAFGSALGNVITIVSLAVAIWRYDVWKKEWADKGADLKE